jgi:acyl homoserine lactone synthase
VYGLQGSKTVIVVVEPSNIAKHSELVDNMFRLRARVFGKRLGWDVQITDGREVDRYDALGPVYIIDADTDGRHVRSSLRLLPTTGPTVLQDFFADTKPAAAELSAPSIWECTRFCLDDERVGSDQREQIVASGSLIAALGEVGLRSGIESILGNFDSTMLRLYRRIGCDVEVLGSTTRYGDPIFLGLFPVNETILSQVKSKLKRWEAAITRDLDVSRRAAA